MELTHTTTLMNSYYILDAKNNTWSRQHYPLHAILARPDITDAHLLADASSGKTLTVAQARASKKPRLTAPEQSLLKACVIGGQKSQKPTLPKPSMPVKRPQSKQQEYGEYKVLSQNDPCFGGRFDADALEHALNKLSRQGWHVLNCQMAAIAVDSGELQDELLIVLRR